MRAGQLIWPYRFFSCDDFLYGCPGCCRQRVSVRLLVGDVRRVPGRQWSGMEQEANQYYDEFGFYSPQELTRASRRQPEEDFPTGPSIGETIPPIVLPDQNGKLVDVSKSVGDRGAIVVFHRSAYW